MRPHFPLLAWIWLATLLVVAPSNADEPGWPRYGFEPGQLLVYEGGEILQSSSEPTVVQRAELRVLGPAPDGRRRIVITHRHQRFIKREGKRSGMPPREDLYVVDVGVDGSIPRRAADSFGVIDRLLPELPGDKTRAASGWTFEAADLRYDCGDLELENGADGARWRFTVTPYCHRDELNGFSSTRTYELSAKSGLMVDLSVEHRVRDRHVRTGFDRLIEMRTIESSTLADLRSDSDRYVAAEREYRQTVADVLGAGPADTAPVRLLDAVGKLEAARREVRSDLFGTAMDQMIVRHHASAASFAQQLRARAAVLDRPAPDWTLLDLDGNTHRLRDYRGRVVVLDFWYRNCGWCIRAMPQIQKLAREFRGRPVAVLGMNVDREIADARFVEERLQLEYPSLRADGRLAAAYTVRSYPTLVIVDGQGVTQYVHAGYSGNLTEELTRVIDGMLAEEQTQGVGN